MGIIRVKGTEAGLEAGTRRLACARHRQSTYQVAGEEARGPSPRDQAGPMEVGAELRAAGPPALMMSVTLAGGMEPHL